MGWWGGKRGGVVHKVSWSKWRSIGQLWLQGDQQCKNVPEVVKDDVCRPQAQERREEGWERLLAKGQKCCCASKSRLAVAAQVSGPVLGHYLGDLTELSVHICDSELPCSQGTIAFSLQQSPLCRPGWGCPLQYLPGLIG